MSPKEETCIDPASIDPWQSECGDVRARLSALRMRGLWADCTVIAGAGAGERISAHRLLLASASPVFSAMLYGPLASPPDQVLTLPEIDPDTARLLIEYIYTDIISIRSCDVACNLYRAAHYLLMPHLESVCRAYLLANVSADCVLHVYEFAQLFDEDKIIDKCIEMIGIETSEVLAAVGVEELPRADTLAKLCSLPTLNVQSELELFKTIERWMRQHLMQQCPTDNPEEKTSRSLILPALQQIRFLTIDPDEFAQYDLSFLLSQADILAISLNLLSTKAHMPMPDGFSTCRDSRCKKLQPRVGGRAATFKKLRPTPTSILGISP